MIFTGIIPNTGDARNPNCLNPMNYQYSPQSGKLQNQSRWARKHTILVISLISLIVAVSTVAVIIYMGMTTRMNTSLQQQSHMKWQDQALEPLTPVNLGKDTKGSLKKQ